MRSLLFVLPFIVLTMFCWGAYGPVIHAGQFSVEEGAKPSSLKPFICVGIAYFLIAVLVPFILLRTKGEKGIWSTGGVVWSLSAGAAGAVGALGIILAFKFHGDPIYVMPLVFGCAPVVNTFVTMAMARSFREASWVFFLGVFIVAIGAAGVLVFKPHDQVTVNEEGGKIEITLNDVPISAENPEELKDVSPKAYKAYQKWKQTRLNVGQLMLVIGCIALTAVCWGAYGPVLHKGQMKMRGSRLRPFICVGLAYFLIAVLAPIPLLSTPLADPPGWNLFTGSIWSLLGGAAGAVGALGIIYSFNFGGKPILVMPLVFGGAPVINTLITTISEGTYDKITTSFYLSMLLVIIGAVIVLVFAPKGGPKKPEAKPDDGPDPSVVSVTPKDDDADVEIPESKDQEDSTSEL